MGSASSARLGFGWALAVITTVVAFGLSLVLGLPLAVAFTASLLLAPAFVALMVSVHHSAPAEQQIWSHLGVVFAAIYATLVTASYFIQLAAVQANSLGASADALKLFAFTPGSAIFAQDMLGYAFMCLATLVAAPVFAGGRLERWLRAAFIVHGLLFAPTLLMTVLFPVLFPGPGSAGGDQAGTLVLLGWCVIFLPIPSLLAVKFRRRASRRPRGLPQAESAT